MPKYTKEDIKRIIKEQDIRFITLQFTDIFGQPKNIAITPSQIDKALDNECMFDGSSIEGFARIEESDQYLRPDLNSFAIIPWSQEQGKVARLICDIYDTEGKPFMGDPRYILRRMLNAAEQEGYSFNVGPECEFFLFHTDENGNPTTHTLDEAGYFDLGTVDHGEAVRREICLALEEMGFEIEASHHEAAVGQHEIDFKYADAMTAADNIVTFKYAVKSLAQKNNLYASFMPKPVYDIAGSGMHVNMSLYDIKNGKNVFVDEADELGLSRIAYNFIAGIMKHINGMTAITNPLVNSYKRLVPGYEAPCYIAWSARNRSPLIRVPAARRQATRIELRSPDPSANPYLALAVCLAAGLEGIKQGLMPPPSVDANIYELSEQECEEKGIKSLPSSLHNAITMMQSDSLVTEVLGSHITGRYIDAKLSEWDDYRQRVTKWEISKYFKTY